MYSPTPTLDLRTAARLDFTAANPRLATADLRDTADFSRLVAAMLAEQGATVGIGGYLENRVIYRRSPHFDDPTTARTLHLGIDVWAPAGTPVAAPWSATIHSLADNNNFGDYGPTVILEHEPAVLPAGLATPGAKLYSLYGHLARREWAPLRPGQTLAAGETFAPIGPYPENGDWPPHLHFQLIRDMQGRVGDFPGVARTQEQAYWAALCPDPEQW